MAAIDQPPANFAPCAYGGVHRWQMSTPRSKARSSTLRRASGKRTIEHHHHPDHLREESNQRKGVSDLAIAALRAAEKGRASLG
jgi:hypothetical protein